MPPSDDRRDSSALRQEGPQQAIEQLPRYAYGMTELPAGLPRATMFPAPRSGEWLKRSEVLAALSASRIAQAPQQQEGLELAPIKARVVWDEENTRHDDSWLVVSRGETKTMIAEIERHRARIRNLETSVDYLRYLVDHPVAPAEGEQ